MSSYDQITSVALDEFSKVDELITTFKQLKNDQKEIDRMHKQLKEERADLIEQLQQALMANCEAEWHVQQQLNEAKVPEFKCDVLKEILDVICILSGYCITELLKIEQRVGRIKLQYKNENCYVVLEMNIVDATYDLIEIYPCPSRFAEIKTFFQKSQDVAGLLGSLLRFFEKSEATVSTNETQ